LFNERIVITSKNDILRQNLTLYEPQTESMRSDSASGLWVFSIVTHGVYVSWGERASTFALRAA
jgi:hypothetical protein